MSNKPSLWSSNLWGSGLILALAAVTSIPAQTQQRQPTRDGGGNDTVTAVEPNRGGDMNLEAQDPDVAQSHLTVADGYEINLFASEQDFPIGNPVAMAVDGKGRVWVSTMPTYPQYYPGKPPEDKLVILEDTDGDGRADRHTVFADGLHLAAGFELGDGGVYVAQQPNLVFLQDTDGDDVADTRDVVLHGFGTEDSHHAISAFTWGPGGALYFQEGTFHHSQVETPWGTVRVENAAVFRYEPTTEKLGVLVSYRFANPWGHCFDQWGQNFIADASGGANYFAAAFSGRVEHPNKHPRMKEFTPTKVRPTSGCEIVNSSQFPDEAQGNFLLNNTIGFHGIKQHRIIDDGSGFTAQEVEPLLQSSDINFRPVDLQFGADGALYVIDWFNPLIGHMQYSLRDPRRDTSHGRVWRITYKGRPLVQPRDVTVLSIEELLDSLKSEERRLRYRARRELRERDPSRVEEALREWVADLDGTEANFEHHLLEALWLFQSLDVVEPSLLERLLATPDYRARAAATRLLRYWHDRLDRPLALLQRLVRDDHPRVRLEAVVALSFMEGARAAELALDARRRETDYYLDYALTETIATLGPAWKPLLSSGEPFAEDNPEGQRFAIESVSPEELARFKPSGPILQVLIDRGQRNEVRSALQKIADLNDTEPTEELVSAIQRAQESESENLDTLVALLAGWDRDGLRSARDKLEQLALRAQADVVRRGAFAAMQRADGGPERAWSLASRSSQSLADMMDAAALIRDADQRNALYGRIKALLQDPSPARGADDGSVQFRRVLRAAIRALAHMDRHAGEVFQLLAGFAGSGAHWNDAVTVMSGIPKSQWAEEEAAALVGTLLRNTSAVPEAERSRKPFETAVAFGLELVGFLPPEQAEEAREAFEELVVQRIRIVAVPKELRFDKLNFNVIAGRPVEILFENPDEMPHNLLVTKPGTLKEVGEAGDAMATQPDAFEKQFVPDTPSVLWATPLLNKGEDFRLRFTAPSKTGGYPYVCTFPGHWMTMNGVMRVRASAR